MMVTHYVIFIFYISRSFASGGYVGLFVGYTVSQAPILLFNVIAVLKKVVAKLKLMSYQHRVEADIEEELGEEVQRK